MDGKRNAKTDAPRPWGRIFGMLVACYVTIVGLVVGLDPEVILLRCLVAATITAVIVRTLVDVIPALGDFNR